MNTAKLNKTLKSVGSAFVIVLGLIAFAAVDANAQRRNDDRYPRQSHQDGPYEQDDRYERDRNNGRERIASQGFRVAFNKGYQAGLKQGMRDARYRQRGNNGAYGSTDGNGNKGRITAGIFGRETNATRQAFQRGYQQGYREGLDRGRNNRRGNNNGRYNNGY